MAHQHPIALRAEQIASQENVAFEEVGPGERAELSQGIISVQLRGQVLDRIVGGFVAEKFRMQKIQNESAVLPPEAMRIKRIGGVQQILLKEFLPKSAGAAVFHIQIRLEPLEQQGTDSRARLSRIEAAQLGLFINVVAAEKFIGPFPGENHSEAGIVDHF